MSIEVWLSVSDAAAAVDFYRSALGAEVEQQMTAGGVVQVARLTVGGAAVWVQQDDDLPAGHDPGRAVRMILTVADPDLAFTTALAAGGVELAAVHDDHGWRTGRLADPFGHQWELARPLH